MNDSYDLKHRILNFRNRDIHLYFLASLSNDELISRVVEGIEHNKGKDLLNCLNIADVETYRYGDINTVEYMILSGNLAIYDKEIIYVLDTKKYPTRSVEQPDTEKSVRGAKDGFNESLLNNTGLIRRRIKCNDLIFHLEKIGTNNPIDIAVVYLDNLCNKKILNDVLKRLKNIRVNDLIMSDRALEELLLDQKYNPFPLVRYSERPDIVASHIQHGNIAIITDTSSLISPAYGEELGVEVLPVSVTINGFTYRDYLDISTNQFIDMINLGGVPMTSQPAIGDVMNAYESTHDDILAITIADGLSGTYMNAVGAKNSIDNNERIHIVNSETLAGCLKYIVEKAAYLNKLGLSVNEIKEQLKETIESSVSFVIPSNFEFLARSGRLTPIAAKIASMLKIVPVLTQTKDRTRIEPFTIKRTVNKAIASIVEHLHKLNVDENYFIFISHARAEILGNKVVKQFKEEFKNTCVELFELSPSLSTHGGPGCIVIQAIKK